MILSSEMDQDTIGRQSDHDRLIERDATIPTSSQLNMAITGSGSVQKDRLAVPSPDRTLCSTSDMILTAMLTVNETDLMHPQVETVRNDLLQQVTGASTISNSNSASSPNPMMEPSKGPVILDISADPEYAEFLKWRERKRKAEAEKAEAEKAEVPAKRKRELPNTNDATGHKLKDVLPEANNPDVIGPSNQLEGSSRSLRARKERQYAMQMDLKKCLRKISIDDGSLDDLTLELDDSEDSYVPNFIVDQTRGLEDDVEAESDSDKENENECLDKSADSDSEFLADRRRSDSPPRQLANHVTSTETLYDHYSEDLRKILLGDIPDGAPVHQTIPDITLENLREGSATYTYFVVNSEDNFIDATSVGGGRWNARRKGEKRVAQKSSSLYMSSQGESTSAKTADYEVTKIRGPHPDAYPRQTFHRSIWRPRKMTGEFEGIIVLSFRTTKDFLYTRNQKQGNAEEEDSRDHSRLRPSISKRIRTLLKENKKPQQIIGLLGSSIRILTGQSLRRTQIYSQVKSLDEMEFSRGRSKELGYEQVWKMHHDGSGRWVKRIDTINRRIFLTNRSMIKTFIDSCLLSPSDFERINEHYSDATSGDVNELIASMHNKSKDDPFNGRWRYNPRTNNRPSGTALYVDQTYDIGKQYLTVFLCKNVHIRTRNQSGDHPQVVVALAFTDSRTTSDYSWIARTLEDSTKELTGNQRLSCRSFVSDGELALHNGLREVDLFKTSYHVQCERHLWENFKFEARRLNLNRNDSKDDLKILQRRIFGFEINNKGLAGRTKEVGLLDQPTEQAFDEEVNRLSQDMLTGSLASLQMLHKYTTKKLNKMFSTYSMKMRVMAGLGLGRTTTNRVECENGLIKDHLKDSSTAKLHIVIHRLEQRYYAMYAPFYDAIFGRGDYRLTDRRLEIIPEDDYHNWRTEEQSEYHQKIGLYEWYEPGRRFDEADHEEWDTFGSFLDSKCPLKDRRELILDGRELKGKCVELDGIIMVKENGKIFETNLEKLTCQRGDDACSQWTKSKIICKHAVGAAYFSDSLLDVLQKADKSLRDKSIGARMEENQSHFRGNRSTRRDGAKCTRHSKNTSIEQIRGLRNERDKDADTSSSSSSQHLTTVSDGAMPHNENSNSAPLLSTESQSTLDDHLTASQIPATRSSKRIASMEPHPSYSKPKRAYRRRKASVE
ncbi:hypothetical protein WR25_23898 isoform A [Diploscapter pachys]|uniref:SWIM-type domain-containing protein n=1 Tax=Diploscapter pachys TaxID=2018661 RepID=A0A2A2LJ48_9BILA|nr:hypothetical protein WR25_23898 isoform A [Diploscapter pachys]